MRGREVVPVWLDPWKWRLRRSVGREGQRWEDGEWEGEWDGGEGEWRGRVEGRREREGGGGGDGVSVRGFWTLLQK